MAKRRSLVVLLALAAIYLSFLLLFELPTLSFSPSDDDGGSSAAAAAAGTTSARGSAVSRRLSALHSSAVDSPPRPVKRAYKPSPFISAVEFRLPETAANSSALEKAAHDAFSLGKKLLDELPAAAAAPLAPSPSPLDAAAACPASIAVSGDEFLKMESRIVELPCGLTLGSHITIVATPRFAHEEGDPKTMQLKDGERSALVSQFMVELQGIKAVDGEAPPKVLHFNPRLKGDFSGKPVIEMNTCYRMQWGRPIRCDGGRSHSDEDTVDGQAKCDRWSSEGGLSEHDASWLRRLIGVGKELPAEWPFPFEEGKLFVLTLTAGLEGYHISIDGRHVSSFPYRTGYGLEDATGLSLAGDLDVWSIFAAELPSSHPSFAPPLQLEMSPPWKAPPLPEEGGEPAELFIGILSASSHFAERMAVRKSWLNAVRQSSSPRIVARFFVALSGRKAVNELLKKEADYFGDIVIVPFLDHYDLVVMKTIAICEYGVNVVKAKHVMKCDDDTFVRVDMVMRQVKRVAAGRSLYVGNMNYYHRPQRHGKWAVQPEEWPEEFYPTYANGPGYVISSDIARHIVSEFEGGALRLFKMEDVSMGLWVAGFAAAAGGGGGGGRRVEYEHDIKFCQFGCIDDYFTAHYQSPRQMLCLWDKLQSGRAQCCNAR